MGHWIYLLLFSLFITFFSALFFFFKPDKNNGSLQAMAEQKNQSSACHCHAMSDVNLNRNLCCKLHLEVQSIRLSDTDRMTF